MMLVHWPTDSSKRYCRLSSNCYPTNVELIRSSYLSEKNPDQGPNRTRTFSKGEIDGHGESCGIRSW